MDIDKEPDEIELEDESFEGQKSGGMTDSKEKTSSKKVQQHESDEEEEEETGTKQADEHKAGGQTDEDQDRTHAARIEEEIAHQVGSMNRESLDSDPGDSYIKVAESDVAEAENSVSGVTEELEPVPTLSEKPIAEEKKEPTPTTAPEPAPTQTPLSIPRVRLVRVVETDGQNKPEELKKDKEITDKPEGGCKYKNFFVSHKRELFLLAGIALVVAFYVRKH